MLDTDIGSDIDDAFALALIIKSPELELVGVTTVSGDTRARARLAAKMLWGARQREIPVAAGEPGKPLPIEQTRWADDFSSPRLRSEKAVDFLESQLRHRPGELTLVAIGPLSNVAALLRSHPDAARKIKRIVLMGGSLARGYGGDPKPTAEYNIASDPAAGRAVFASGIPILMVPLDVTAMLQLDAAGRQRIFNRPAPLANALASLYRLWNHPTPTLFDPMAVAMLVRPSLCETKALGIEVDSKGYTRVRPGAPANAAVALHTDPAKFFAFLFSRLAP